MAQQCPQYAGTPHYGLVYPSTYYVQGYPTHQGGYVGHPSAITGHRPASLGYQPLGGHPGHHQNPQNHQVTPAHPATPTVGATQACNFPYGHIHHHRTHPSHANTRPSGHFLDSRTPYKHTYPPSPNSVVFPDPPPTFAASPPPFEDRQQPYTGERTQNQQPQPWAQQTTGTWHDSIPAWSERVPALDLNSELPFQATGHHAHVGVPQMQQGTYIDNTNVVVPPQPQGMYDGADGYPFGMVQASPALTWLVYNVRIVCED